MSALWRARVLAVSSGTVELNVHAVHPDAGAFSSSKVFAHRLLADAPGLDGRLPQEGAAEDAVAAVELSQVRNYPFDTEGAKLRVAADVRSSGITPEDQDAWLTAFGRAWHDLWDDVEQVPTARLAVRLSDPSLLTGLRPGTEWESAAYG
ncbi:hypothetical protein ACIBKZ_02955 [Streptomyces sp. NPDC050421]|uniref:hypothetical protein n=1 Tax=Streptomyces sp. NPDC050421 TaxID=3365613 RepID=UPI0037BB4479